MVALGATIHEFDHHRLFGPIELSGCGSYHFMPPPAMRGGWVYIMTNRPNGTLYLGVTNDLVRRAREQRMGLVKGFTQRYDLDRLVYAERHEDIQSAIRREKTLKQWPRAWKVRLIVAGNPAWADLYDDLK
jgi:putative endonuclease